MRAVNSSSTAWRVVGSRGRGARSAPVAEVAVAELRVAGRGAHGAHHRLVVEPVQRGSPGRLAGALEGGAGGRGVADADQLGLGVPAEGGEGIVHRPAWYGRRGPIAR